MSDKVVNGYRVHVRTTPAPGFELNINTMYYQRIEEEACVERTITLTPPTVWWRVRPEDIASISVGQRLAGMTVTGIDVAGEAVFLQPDDVEDVVTIPVPDPAGG